MTLEIVTQTQWRVISTLLGVVSAVALLRVVRHHGWRRALTVLVCILPTFHASLLLGEAIPSAFLHWARLWATPIPTLFGLLIAWRAGLLTPKSAISKHAAWHESCWVACVFLLSCAVAGPIVTVPSSQLALLAVVDASRSIQLVPDAESRIHKELKLAEIGMRPDDSFGVVKFGARARLQTPLRGVADPFVEYESDVAPDGTNLDRAIQRALSELPAHSNGRLALLSDGVPTLGNLQNSIELARAKHVPIDTLLLERRDASNIHLTRFAGPTTINRGEPFEFRVVIDTPRAANAELRLSLNGMLKERRSIQLPGGQTAYTLPQVADAPGLHAYTLQITSTDPDQDPITSDNQLTEFVSIKGPSNVLVVSGLEGGPSPLAQTLEDARFNVSSIAPESLPDNLNELSKFDLVAIGSASAERFSSLQLLALERYVNDLGGGVFLTGSAHSLGPGGFSSTPIETISPVSFETKQQRQAGQLAEVIVVDCSGSMATRIGSRTKLELAHESVLQSISLLNGADLLGILHVDKRSMWTLPLQSVVALPADLNGILARVSPGGGGISVDVGLRAALRVLTTTQANLRHVIVLADGADAEGTRTAEKQVRAARRLGITTSVIALGGGQNLAQLEHISSLGQGRFYLLDNVSQLPAIFAQETLAASQSSLQLRPFRALATSTTGILKGINLDSAPMLEGYVVTLPKTRAQLTLTTSTGDPLLASWSIGLGRVGVFTSDYGEAWGGAWASWSGGPQLFAQTIRSLVRVVDDSQVQMRVVVQAGELQIRADALDALGNMDRSRSLQVEVLGPDGTLSAFAVAAVGGGRYALDIPLDSHGNYLVNLRDLATGKLVARGGAEHRAGQELDPMSSDPSLLRRIAFETGGEYRDTLAGIFPRSKLTTGVSRDASAVCLGFGSALLVLSVALARLRLPAVTWRTKARERAPDLPTAGVEVAGKPPAAEAKSAAQTLLDRRRSR